eukprot:scaffold86790_cov73-Phaeocystis_antarctica.AAC.6
MPIAELLAQQLHCLASQRPSLVIAALALQLRCARAQLEGAGQASTQLPARARAPRLANRLEVAQRQRIGALHHQKNQVFRKPVEALHWRLCDRGVTALCAAHDLVRIARSLARGHFLLAGRARRRCRIRKEGLNADGGDAPPMISWSAIPVST